MTRALAAALLFSLALGVALPAARAADEQAPQPAVPHSQGPSAAAISSAVTAEPPAATSARVLGLAEAVETALARQPTLVQASASSRAAAARADQARSGLLPQVAASAVYARGTTNLAGLDGRGTGTSWSTTGSWRFGATLSQLVWDFGQSSSGWRAAQESARAVRRSEAATRDAVVLGVQAAFFTARAGRDLLAVARENLQNQELHLRQIEGFVRAGTRPAIDLAQARTDRANAAVQQVQAENAYLTEKAQLNQAMGVEGPIDYQVGDDALPAIPGEDASLDALLDEALLARPDLAALASQARAQELTIDAASAARWPSLGFTTGLTNGGYALDSTVWNWEAQLTLSWNLFQGGLVRARTDEARANLDVARALLASERQAIRVELTQAQLAVRAARETLAASGEALVNAREQLRLAEGRYRAGVGSVIELGDAQVKLTSAAAQRVKAEYDLATARAQLQKALGRPPEA